MWALAPTAVDKAVEPGPLRAFAAHTDWVWDLALAAEGAKLVSGAADGCVVVWDLAGGTPDAVHRVFELSVSAVTMV